MNRKKRNKNNLNAIGRRRMSFGPRGRTKENMSSSYPKG